MPDNNPGYGKTAFWVAVGVLIGLAAAAGFLVGQRAGQPGPPVASPLAVSPVASDIDGFISTMVGVWKGPGEQLLIKNDRGVLEILHEMKLEGGKIRLDQYAGAPVRLDASEHRLFLDLPGGAWQLVLLPGTRRAQLSVTYPDSRNVLYQ